METKRKKEQVPVVVVDVMSTARQLTMLAVETLSAICATGKNEAAKVAAAKELLTRAWGHAHTTPPAGNAPSESRITVVFPEDGSDTTKK